MTHSLARLDRMLALTERVGDCWIWVGRLNEWGYGTYGRDLAHRAMYEEIVGPIPKKTHLDHFVCEQPACVNPSHVRPASSRENTLRGETLAAANLAKTKCPRHHPYSEENTYVDPMGRRHCRACQRERGAAWYRKNRGKRATSQSGN